MVDDSKPKEETLGPPAPPSVESDHVTAAGRAGEHPTEGAKTTESPVLQEPPEAPGKEEHGALVVGIGASAGGLEALGDLFRHLPTDHTTFIVVQHMSPEHESMLPQLLARSSALQIVTATDNAPLEPNKVYVTPPNADLAVMNGVLRVITPQTRYGPRLPVDYLFRSLAAELGSASVGVVLSGTGTDGTFGLKAIKAAGGLTFVQDPSTARYDGMPRSALASGAADFCLAPQAMAEELARIGRRTRAVPPSEAAPAEDRPGSLLARLFLLIRSEFGTDLTQYKRTTIDRRIERRMALRKIERLEEYVNNVLSNRDELETLYKDMLITVTSFFRDPEAFAALKSTIFPKLLEDKGRSDPIRVWIPACSSGEEAYSIAICLVEYLEERTCDTPVQIFGTDIDEDSIQHARKGFYAANIALDVSQERLDRFFVKKEDEYVISRRIRDLIVFSKQDVLRDAPFSRMDLVSCRNLLIYLQSSAQRRVLRTLHYALKPTGYLLLGSAETVGDAPDLFSLIDRKNKLYSKKQAPSQAEFGVAFGPPREPESLQHVAPTRSPTSLPSLADRKVLELYGPAGVIIDETLAVMQFRGHMGPFLGPMPGAPSLNLLRLVRFELHVELKAAIQRALSEQRRVTSEVTYEDDGRPTTVRLDIVPLEDPEAKTRCLLVLFARMPPPKEVPVVMREGGEAAGPLAQRINELERELAMAKEYVQATNEERESALEELKAANEELQSSNEELQSTNEELETSKEELQSTNEELTTVNDELRSRMTELGQTNDDLHNVLTGMDNPIVIVGMDLRIRRYTAAAEKLFSLMPADVGRSVSLLDSFLGATPVEPKVSGVIQTLSPVEEEVLASNRRWYTLKITPYKTLTHSIQGALITLVDMDVRKRAAMTARDVGAYAAQFLAPIGHPLLIVDRKVRVVWCNDAFLATFQLTREETVGSLFSEIGARQFAEPTLQERLEAVFVSGSIFRDCAIRLRLPELVERTARVSGSQIPVSVETPLVLLSIEVNGEIARAREP